MHLQEQRIGGRTRTSYFAVLVHGSLHGALRPPDPQIFPRFLIF